MSKWQKITAWSIPLTLAFATAIYQANNYFKGPIWILIANILYGLSALGVAALLIDFLLGKFGNGKQEPKDSRLLAHPLETLPVYFDDLKIDLLGICYGTTFFDFQSKTTFFLKLDLCSDTDTGLRDLAVTFVIKDTEYRGTPLEDVSEWLIKIPIKTATYPYRNANEHSLNEFSIWQDVRRTGLKAGLLKTGWIGVEVPVSTIGALENLKKVRIEVTKPKNRKPYRFTFTDFKPCEETIFHIAFRE